MKITYEMLVEKGACKEGLEWFKTTFPDGCELNDETINNLCSSEYESDYIWWFYNNVQQDKRLYRLCGVNRSYGVNRSGGVNRSDGVNGSYGVNGSFGVINSYGVDRALFLADKPREYTIFGSKVSKDRFFAVQNTLLKKLNGWRPVFNNIKVLWLANGSDWQLTPIQNAEELSKQEAWSGMPKEAIDYVASLPEFDADMFFKITGITVE